mmetsp:Transcript_24248/g.59349  ORF Transcript_24248/g.59349 Transcript_24248/m.59349 type:complete len:465 (+) Transcript_24248:152-1546(+)
MSSCQFPHQPNQSPFSYLDCSNQPRTAPPVSEPRTKTSPLANEIKAAEDIIASELNKLSFKERAEAYNDVHCVGDDLEENPSIIQQGLGDFDATLQTMRSPIYDLAVNQNRAYVEDASFRLKFLRANMYDVGKSVRQMLSFLHQKATYFGQDKVARDITIDDLNREDIALLKCGLFHIQNGRDRMGRVVLVCFKNKMPRVSAAVMNRATYYISFNILLSIPEVQLKGIVTVQLNAKQRLEEQANVPSFSYIHEITKFSNSVPLRCSALHNCFDTSLTGAVAVDKAILGLWYHCLPEHTRSRMRFHCGSRLEIIYQFQSHGIPMDTFPVDFDFDIREDILNVWVQKHLETAQRSSRIANLMNAKPGQIFEQDILLGRGGLVQSHPGNVRFRAFLEGHRDEYETSARFVRHKVAAKFVRMLNAKGARFLVKGEDGVWVESTFSDAERKVGQYFRELRKKKSKAVGL